MVSCQFAIYQETHRLIFFTKTPIVLILQNFKCINSLGIDIYTPLELLSDNACLCL